MPGKVTLEQIVKRYDDTPFGVSPSGPVVTIARTDHGVFRGWSERTKPDAAESDSDKKESGPIPIHVFVELVAEEEASEPEFSFADPPAVGLELLDGFQKAEVAKQPSDDGSVTARFVASLYEAVALDAGEIIVPVNFAFTSTDEGEAKSEGKLQVVLRTPRKSAASSGSAAMGVALIGGTLELRLGHLCDQKGCVEHFHKSLSEMAGLGAVQPRPSLEEPRATIYLRAGQAIDVWKLRESLRDQSVEITQMFPHGSSGYRLRVDLPRWHFEKEAHEAQQCIACRDRVANLLEALSWTSDIVVAGGGISFRPKKIDVDLTALLDKLTKSGAAPAAVWLVPEGVPMPKGLSPQLVQTNADPKTGGLQVQPVVEFDLAHTCDVGTELISLLNQQKWASQTHLHAGDIAFASASIADRKYANLTPLLTQFRSAGHTPSEIRLRGFGDIRVQVEFAHICGEIEYSKPPKRKKKSDEEKAKEKKKEDTKPKKPFVPTPLRPAASSNGRKAIEAAVNRVSWIQDGVFQDYHTKPEFRGGPRKLMVSLQPSGEDVVRLDELVKSLREAGFPPKSLIVSRRFSGIPFAKPMPAELELTDREGKKQKLGSIKQPNRPLAIAFVSLKCKRKKYKDYEPDPKSYETLGKTVEQYKDRVDVVAVSASPDDEFADVADFWDTTGLSVPLLHDAEGVVRAALNAQATPAPHTFVFDGDGLFRYAGEPHDNWQKPDKEHDDYLAKALELVLTGEYQANGAVFFNKSLCNCSDPNCKCPKCGCGPSCRCATKH
jgi:hypothetical protein